MPLHTLPTGRLGNTIKRATVATVVIVFIGLFFGYYPARRASKLLPIECLRQD